MPHSPGEKRAMAREKQRRYRLRKRIEQYGPELAAQDMRGRHGNHVRGEQHPHWKGVKARKEAAAAERALRRGMVAPQKTCKCGCGTVVKSTKALYAPGHNRRASDERVAELFWTKVRKGESCWEWQASVNSSGYGWFRFGEKRTPTGAHRVAYVLANGPIPDGLQVLHRCDNPPCVNPTHLFLGTNGDNHADKLAKGRHPNTRKSECRHGHPLDDANTYVDAKGTRHCRACCRARQRGYGRIRRERQRCQS